MIAFPPFHTWVYEYIQISISYPSCGGDPNQGDPLGDAFALSLGLPPNLCPFPGETGAGAGAGRLATTHLGLREGLYLEPRQAPMV